MLFRRVGMVVVVAVVTSLGCSWARAQGAKATTLDNLQAAYNGESNAAARYGAFAKQADVEGYGAAASLFRAAAKAEQVHAATHAAVIRKMGAEPKADVQAPEVKGTKENLRAALRGETYERDTMYPDFLKQSRAEGNADAVRSFNRARTAEAEHAKLYQQALDNLDQWKGPARTFYVCPACGYTVSELPPPNKKCVSCYEPTDKYEAVS